MESGGPGPRGLLLQLAVAHNASGGPRTAAFLSGFLARICREADPVHAGLILSLFSTLSERATVGEDVSVLLGEPCSAHIESWMPGLAATLVAEAKVPSLKATGELLRDVVPPVAG